MNTHTQKDTDIREALRQRLGEELPLPADFEERVVRAIAPKRTLPWRRIAAMVIGTLLLAGIVYASLRLFMPRQQTPPVAHANVSDTTTPASMPADSIVSFDNQPLEQLLATVATYYGKALTFRQDAPRGWRITTMWNRSLPLGAFIESLNELNGLRLTVCGDTLLVEHVTEREGEE